VKDDGKMGRQAYLLRYGWKPASAVAVLLLGVKGWEVVDSEARSSGEVNAPEVKATRQSITRAIAAAVCTLDDSNAL
jgi:hypothetical protein